VLNKSYSGDPVRILLGLGDRDLCLIYGPPPVLRRLGKRFLWMDKVEASHGRAKAPLGDLPPLRRILGKWKAPWYQFYPEIG